MSDEIIGFHVIGSTYGFWLPNDQRGSGSDYTRSVALRQFGPPTKVFHRNSVAHRRFDIEIRRMAREALAYPPVELDDEQIAAVIRGIKREVETYHAATMHAFVQLRNHFHFVCGPCRYDIRRFEGRLKGAATKRLLEEGIHPFQRLRDRLGQVPSPWSVKPWVVYCFTKDDMIRSVDYAYQNLVRSRMRPQDQSFCIPYPGAKAPGAYRPGAAHRR